MANAEFTPAQYTIADAWNYGGWDAIWQYYLLPVLEWLGSGFHAGVNWSENTVYAYDEWIGDWFFVISLGLFALEGVR